MSPLIYVNKCQHFKTRLKLILALRYTGFAPAKSGAGFGDSNIQKAHKRPQQLGAFFVPAVYVMAVCAGRLSGLPVSFCAGSPTPHTLPPLFGDSGGSDLTLQKEAPHA